MNELVNDCDICGRPTGDKAIRVSLFRRVCSEDCRRKWVTIFPKRDDQT
jgi:hypothetical protein